MASATVLIMQQTQTPDLSPLSDQKIPLHQVKIRDEDSADFNRVLPLASGPGGGRYNSARSRKAKNGIKKQPQRGLGVAKLEKMRLQESPWNRVQTESPWKFQWRFRPNGIEYKRIESKRNRHGNSNERVSCRLEILTAGQLRNWSSTAANGMRMAANARLAAAAATSRIACSSFAGFKDDDMKTL